MYFRVTDGTMKPGDTVKLMNTKVEHEILDMGVLAPKPVLVRACGFCRGRTGHRGMNPQVCCALGSRGASELEHAPALACRHGDGLS